MRKRVLVAVRVRPMHVHSCVCVCVIWSIESIYQGQKGPKVSETNGPGTIHFLPLLWSSSKIN